MIEFKIDEKGNIQISEDGVVELFSGAVSRIYSNDKRLLNSNISERTLSYRLAMYIWDDIKALEKHGVFVDAEYNRDGDSPLQVKRTLTTPHGGQNDESSCIIPDIIIHERGSSNIKGNPFRNDIVYCEIKKDEGSNNDDSRKVARQVFERNYQYGINLHKLNLNEASMDVYRLIDDRNYFNKNIYRFDFGSRRFIFTGNARKKRDWIYETLK